jgi:hypothetical protein
LLDDWFQTIIDFNQTVHYYCHESLVFVIQFIKEHYYKRAEQPQAI